MSSHRFIGGVALLGMLGGVAMEVAAAPFDPMHPYPKVTADALLVRKNVKDMTKQEKADFVGAILALKQTRAPGGDMVGNWYDHFVAQHMRKLVCWTDQPGQGGLGHSGPDLLTWHRAFLLEFEYALWKVARKPIAIPYWDWTDPASEAAMLADDMMGPGGKAEDGYVVMSGPFRKGRWKINVKGFTTDNPGQFDDLVRGTGNMAGATTAPLAADVVALLQRPLYDVAPWGVTSDTTQSFRNFLDGGINATGLECKDGVIWDIVGATSSRLHAQGHMYIGGQDAQGNPGALTDTVTSPNDPIFWLHHANVDRLLEMWWKQHRYQYLPKTGGPRGDNIGDILWPYPKLTNGGMARPTRMFGYRYADLTPPQVPEGQTGSESQTAQAMGTMSHH